VTEVSQAIKRGILEYNDSIEILSCPLADGWEVSLDVLKSHLSLNSSRIEV